MMELRRVGSTDIRISAVGFGTCQFRLIPEKQAIDTLLRGFELGVNWVHTAQDYGGAEEIIAKAIKASGKEIIVFSNGFGEMPHFEYLFNNTRRIFKKDSLETWGISCIDDHEFLGLNVWEPGGMVESLKKKKEEGKIRSTFCSTHGSPEYVTRLITSGCFDAIMLAYNPLGFHVLSYYGESEGKDLEKITRSRTELFPLALEHNVSLLVMKPLAGGMLCSSKAFPPGQRFSQEKNRLQAKDILRTILVDHPAICAVVPGTATVEEAEENARSGYAPIEVTSDTRNMIQDSIEVMRRDLCNRCGDCEVTCSKKLEISWLFRDAYIWNYPSDLFEAIARKHYFHLHPEERLACESCEDRTCSCPEGIDIPAHLALIHARMVAMKNSGVLPATPKEIERNTIQGKHTVQLLWSEVPKSLPANETGVCRLWLQNPGPRWWRFNVASAEEARDKAVVGVFNEKKRLALIPLRHDVGPSMQIHVAFELRAPAKEGSHMLRFYLMESARRGLPEDATLVLTRQLLVEKSGKPALGMLERLLSRLKEKIIGPHY